jgi:hypothetical protein
MKAFALAVLWPAMILSAAESSPWNIDTQPALAPGEIGSWDDFAITNAAVLRTGNSFAMFYVGFALTSDARTSAIGIARSGDGVAWKKHDDNPVLGLDLAPDEYVSSVSVAKWKDEFRAVYVVEREFTSTPADEKEPPPRVMTARSEDGTIWQQAKKLSRVSFDPPESVALRPCVYADSELLHMWWIGLNENEPVLCHSVSRDGENWSKPNHQAMREIDAREVSSVRAYPSGDFTILVYVAEDHPGHASIVTKIARNARSWTTKGPPEFPIERSGWHTIPEMVFNPRGARLFYTELLSVDAASGKRTSGVRGAILRAAFCPKSAYVGQ